MSHRLDWDDMMRVPVDRLNDHACVPVRIFNEPAEMMESLARKIAELIHSRNARDKPTHFIFPVGPKRHYPLLAEICNRERISWSNCSCFNMDKWLDWQCRSLPLSHPFSLERYTRRNLFDLLDADLRPPDAQLHFPSPENLTTISDRINEAGGIDKTGQELAEKGVRAIQERLGGAQYHHDAWRQGRLHPMRGKNV